MITNLDASIALSNLGWVDQGSVFRLDARTRTFGTVQLSDAKHLVLSSGRADLFSAVHHFGGRRFMVTAQTFDHPDRPLATIDVRDWSPQLSGDPQVWNQLSPAYVGYLDGSATGELGVFLLRIRSGVATLTSLRWFDDEYDHGYQSVFAVEVVPETGDLLFGVGRSSELVLCDGRTEQVKRKISLAERYGNPRPHISGDTAEAWAVDSDTLVRLDRRTWRKTGELRVQRAAAPTQLSVGDAHFSKDGATALIPRPYSGDVIHVDTRTLRPVAMTRTGGQPSTAALLSTGEVVARDQMTGQLLTSTRDEQGWRKLLGRGRAPWKESPQPQS